MCCGGGHGVEVGAQTWLTSSPHYKISKRHVRARAEEISTASKNAAPTSQLVKTDVSLLGLFFCLPVYRSPCRVFSKPRRRKRGMASFRHHLVPYRQTTVRARVCANISVSPRACACLCVTTVSRLQTSRRVAPPLLRASTARR